MLCLLHGIINSIITSNNDSNNEIHKYRIKEISIQMTAFPDDVSKILDILKENPRGMSVTDVTHAIEINRNTVSRYLDILLVSGQVEMKTYGKAKVFFLSQRVPISAILNCSSDMLIVLDRDMRIMQVNDAVCNFVGSKRDSIIGAELRDSPLVAFDHPLIRVKIREGIEGSECMEELRFRKVEEDLFFRFKIIPAVFNDGSTGVTIIMEDITAQKHSEEALKESENTYRTLVEKINDLIWNVDENGVLTYVSPRVKDILGYDPASMLGKTLYSFMVEKEADRIKKSLLSSVPKPYSFLEYSVIDKNGNSVTLESSGSPMFDEFGEFIGYNIVSRDVSERNVAIKRVLQWKSFLFSIVDNIPAKVMVKELENDTYVFFNRSAEEFLGKSRDVLLAKTDAELFGKENAVLLKRMDEKLLKTGLLVEEPEIAFGVMGLGKRILRLRKIPILNSETKPKFILSIGEDITQRKESERLLIEERDLAQSYLEVAGVMIAVVDTSGIITRINQKGCTILGYSQAELIGKDWFSVLVPEQNREILRSNFYALLAESGTVQEREFGSVITKSGEERRILWHNSLLRDSDGKIIAMVSSGDDITNIE
jgi:PAS domain S-box-containing protein